MGKRKVRKQAIQEAELFLRVVTKDNQMLSSCFQADSSRPGLELWDMTKLLCSRHSRQAQQEGQVVLRLCRSLQCSTRWCQGQILKPTQRQTAAAAYWSSCITSDSDWVGTIYQWEQLWVLAFLFVFPKHIYLRVLFKMIFFKKKKR